MEPSLHQRKISDSKKDDLSSYLSIYPLKKKALMMCSIIAASEYDTIGVAFITFIVDAKNRYNEQNNVRRELQKDI